MKKIERETEACLRLACKRSKFRAHYVLRSPDDPYIPGTTIKRLKPVPLGERGHGFLSTEVDVVIDAVVALRDDEVHTAALQQARARASERATAKLPIRRRPKPKVAAVISEKVGV
jgi:hypothetical protein